MLQVEAAEAEASAEEDAHSAGECDQP